METKIEISKKGIVLSLMAIALMIGFINAAAAMYSGESMTFETNLTAPVYTVTGNSSTMEGLNVIFEGGNITITTNPLMDSDNFTIIFFDEVTKEITNTVTNTVHSGSGSSGGTTRYVETDVITYVPEYINSTNEIETIIDNETVLENGFKLWHLLFIGVVGMIFGGLVIYNWRKDGDEETN